MRENSFLLDTQVFIWAMEESKRLPLDIKNKISDPGNNIFISVATIWEIVIKKKIKKIKLSFGLEASIKKAGFEIIPIITRHALGVGNLPLHHRDPFDRILISQAQAEKLIIISSDPKFSKYSVDILKC